MKNVRQYWRNKMAHFGYYCPNHTSNTTHCTGIHVHFHFIERHISCIIKLHTNQASSQLYQRLRWHLSASLATLYRWGLSAFKTVDLSHFNFHLHLDIVKMVPYQIRAARTSDFEQLIFLIGSAPLRHPLHAIDHMDDESRINLGPMHALR